ncbi:MAG: MarC family protein [Crocosphaera sp.]|nr:MarC family protein [Crocosphaera sp.]
MLVLDKINKSDLEVENIQENDLVNIIEQQIRFIQELRKIYGKDSLFRMAIILFMTIGPIKIIPVFVILTQKSSAKIRIKLAIRSFALSTTAILAVALSSQNILNKYNISLSALLATAGLILSLISIKMLLAQYEKTENAQNLDLENPLKSLISPLTFPTILTPQGIAFVMISMTIAHRLDNNVHKLLGLIILVMILNLVCMLYAREILNFLKPTLLQVFGLTLNIIQLALGISFIFSAINLQFLTIYYILDTSF